MLTAIPLATITWFILAAILFFNPIVDRIYASQEGHASVRALPKNGATIARILGAVLLQCTLWAFVFQWVEPSLPAAFSGRTMVFGTIIVLLKMIPRDVDRLLLSTYPAQRMIIEFIIGCLCAYAVAAVFAYAL